MRLVENQEFPSEVSDDFLIQQIANEKDRDDPYEGDVPEAIARYPRWTLTHLPIATVSHAEQDYDPDVAADYARMDRHTAPPIIYDNVRGELWDGYHRLHAAILRGDTDILAYVPKP